MIKPRLEEVERDENHVIYLLSATFDETNLYERAKVINRFLTSESKMLEKVIETDLRHIFLTYGIIPYDNSESALKQAFAMLKRKRKTIEIVDRYQYLPPEDIVGVSENQMTVIVESGGYISLSVEIKVIDL